MAAVQTIVNSAAPTSLAAATAAWPTRAYHPSPSDWRDQVLYFLLPDRFSDGQEKAADLLRADLSTKGGIEEIQRLRDEGWRWDEWLDSGQNRYQGGTLKGIRSKLGYLKQMGVTTLWVAPVFRQRVEENSYHGYGIQNFLDIDSRFGTRADLIALVDDAHQRGMYIILDIIFNHSGCNWLYDEAAGNIYEPPYRAVGGYDPVHPRNGFGHAGTGPRPGPDDYVWPSELQTRAFYVGAGRGNLGAGSIFDEQAEHKRTDFCSLRKMNLFQSEALYNLALIYHYWIALADVDGYRIDTLKHVTLEQSRNFCNALKEYAEVLGKDRFLVVGEVAGGDTVQDAYLDINGRNLDACLDIGEQRERLCRVSQGLVPASDYFAAFSHGDPGMGSHRDWGSRHLSIVNDHDHVFGPKLRYAVDAPNSHQGAAATALQLFTLGIPCIYYGTEQGLASGAEPAAREYLPWGSSDALLREAMFGPAHPRASGWEGTQGKQDPDLPGFGPHGTSGKHVFNEDHPVYRRIAQMTQTRAAFAPLRRGRQYLRETAYSDTPFGHHGAGQIVAWSRVYDEQEVLVVMNTNGAAHREARIVVDARLSGASMQVVMNTDPAHPMAVGVDVPVAAFGELRFVAIAPLGPSEVMVLANAAALDERQ